MKINKYKIKNTTDVFLLYTLSEELSIPLKDLNLELVEEQPTLDDNEDLSILKAEDLLERIINKSRTRDKVLSEEGIDSWKSLKTAYYDIKKRIRYFPKRMREFINEKYSEIINNYEYLKSNQNDL